MTMTIEFTPSEEERLFSFARQTGRDPVSVLKQLVTEHLPKSEKANRPLLTAENDPAMALLESWIAAAPTDPDEIREAEEDRRELLNNLNRNRIEAGERPLFP